MKTFEKEISNVVEKPNITTGITHSGKFHCDDVCCTALLQLIYPDIKIIRVPDIDKLYIDTEVTIVYDIGGGKYDHHGLTSELRDDGITYSSFGKLYRDFAKYLMPSNIAKYIDTGFVREIDRMDNGQGYSSFGAFLNSFNAPWNDTTADENTQFFKAVNAAKEFMTNMINKRKSEEEANKIIDEACRVQNSKVIIFDRQIPLHNFIKDTVLYAIIPSSRSGYNLQSLKDKDGKIRKKLPTSWNTHPPKGMIFYHSSGSLANFETLQDAIEAANSIFNNSKFPASLLKYIKDNSFEVMNREVNKKIKIDGVDILSNNEICAYYENSSFYTLNPIKRDTSGIYIDTSISYGTVDNRDNSNYSASALEFNKNSTIKIVQRTLNNGSNYDI